jgi:hypothetical protein
MDIVGYILTVLGGGAGLFASYFGLFSGKSLIELSRGDIVKILFGLLIIIFFLVYLLFPLYPISLIQEGRYYLSFFVNILYILVSLFLVYAGIMGLITIRANSE